MIETKDIIDRIDSDFGDKASKVRSILEAAILKAGHLNNDRIIRCILFLANADLIKLQKNIEAATGDPRDVMYWAEYVDHGKQDGLKRVWDFSRPFNEAGDGL